MAEANKMPENGISVAAIRVIVLAAVKAEREPDPEVAEQAAKDKERKRMAREQTIAVVQAEMDAVTNRQDNCNHLKENGRPRTGGQLHSDGYIHIFCLNCQKEVNKYKPNMDQMAMA